MEKIDHDLCAVPAAIADYVPEKKTGKIPSTLEALTVNMKPNVRVLERIRKRFDGTLIGFKLESGVKREELIKRAKARLKGLDLDYVVANDMVKVKKGYADWAVIRRQGEVEGLKGSKREASWKLWDVVLHGLEG